MLPRVAGSLQRFPKLTAFIRTLLDDANAATALATLTARGQGKETIWIPAGSMQPAETNGAEFETLTVGTNTYKLLAFDPTTEEYANFQVRLPKSYNLGTVTFTPVWSHPTTTVNFGVVWALAGGAMGDGESLGVTLGSAVAAVDTGATADIWYHAAASAAMTIGNTPASLDLTTFRLLRSVANGSDTLAVDARLIGITLNFTTNAVDDT